MRWKQVIGGDCSETRGPLLVRYYILHTRWFGVYLHHLMRSDIERHQHDHPWPFVSILLTGSYVEHTPEGATRRKRGSVLFRPACWIHRLELKQPIWTLVLVGRTCRHWGFHTEHGWLHWREYKYTAGEEC
jgi:hypothetical protein